MTISDWYGDASKGINKLLASSDDSLESKPHNVFRGGAGLVSTVRDYFTFCLMLINNGELDGFRYLSRKTVELMTANHLTSNLMPIELGGIFLPGYGFGLGFRVLLDVGQCQTMGSVGNYGWIGAANTYFWIDPKEDLIGILMAQFQPNSFHLISDDFRVMAYQAVAD